MIVTDAKRRLGCADFAPGLYALRCGRPARRRKRSGRQSAPARAQTLRRAIIARQLQALVSQCLRVT